MKKYLYPIWGALYIICVCLGAISERSAAGEVVLTVISVLFFVPGFLLLADGLRTGDAKALKTLRLISGLSLGLTLLALIGNILSVFGSTLIGDIAYAALLVVSVPMLCCKFWALSLLLWAILLCASFPRLWRK